MIASCLKTEGIFDFYRKAGISEWSALKEYFTERLILLISKSCMILTNQKVAVVRHTWKPLVFQMKKIVDFLSYAEVTNSPLPDETRSVYTFNAYVLGDSKGKCSFVEFAPRKGRNNYRISRQNMKYKHPAWSLDNGFPEPSKGDDGEYTSAGDFVGIIDNLVILIIRTTNRRYYAGL